MRKAAIEYTQTKSASSHPIGLIKIPYTANNVTNILVVTADQNNVGEGLVDQNGFLVLEMNIVRCPAIASSKKIKDCKVLTSRCRSSLPR